MRIYIYAKLDLIKWVADKPSILTRLDFIQTRVFGDPPEVLTNIDHHKIKIVDINNHIR